MGVKKKNRSLLVAIGILCMAIIHFGVGIGIVARYRKYHDVFLQQVGLSGYNIVIGIFGMALGIIAIFAVIKPSELLTKITAILAFVVGFFATVSAITALGLSSQEASYLRQALTDNMNSYIQDDTAIDVMDQLQTNYECCGVNLWLDWSRVSLGNNNLNYGRRRRRHPTLRLMKRESPLIHAIRQKRQSYIDGGQPLYNLPSSYTVNLPLSCCRNGGTSTGNTLGGYCVFNAYNGTSSFYVEGCIGKVADRAFAQTAGIIVINTCLAMLCFVCFGNLATAFIRKQLATKDVNKQMYQDQSYQISYPEQQQYQVDPSYANNYNPYPDYGYNYPSENYGYNYPVENYGYSNPNPPMYL